ncbi:hypothetical protein RND71_012891 [Anisodus tanguticus]|uniref:Uncharacterized protein n=1 Tax=Anisodus tanguticus TaxID=243964 RepID=A0AAE1VQA2_9SOLA|nr:hypothetical protein RND71_012891 [Anisodus tanguticus]
MIPKIVKNWTHTRKHIAYGDGIVRADVPFRRAESKYSVEQVGVIVEFYGDELNNVSYSDPATVKKYVRRAQLGENVELDRATLKSDGVFRCIPRGKGDGAREVKWSKIRDLMKSRVHKLASNTKRIRKWEYLIANAMKKLPAHLDNFDTNSAMYRDLYLS